MRRSTRPALLLIASLVLAACGGADSQSKADRTSSSDAKPVEGLLVVDGNRRDGNTRVAEPQLEARKPEPAPATNAVFDALRESIGTKDPWPAPPMLTDGTIDDGVDPFLDEVVPVQPVPIEDDPATTRDIDAWSQLLRTIDRDEWTAWMDAKLKRPFGQDETDPILDGIVRISVERCGGARTVATGAVVAPETVVTTVHAIESAQRRVRVSPAMGTAYRVPAMVRYLDIDDDVAVLKVPGLKADPLPFYSGGGSEPQRGYAYGISRGSPAGAVRRAPAMVAVAEEKIDVEQPDGFGADITDRQVFPIVAAIDSGFSGGVVTTTSDPEAISGFAVQGLIRARVPYRAQTAGIVVPARIVQQAVSNSQQLDTWFEHPAGRCPQWTR